MGNQRSAEQELLRAVLDSTLDPQIVFEPVCDPDGRVADFVYREFNRATCEYLGERREDLIGRSLVEMFPSIVETDLFQRYRNCSETGASVVLDNVPFVSGVQGTSQRYDIRVGRMVGGLISVTFRDVTERYAAQERLAESEERYRLLAENRTGVAIDAEVAAEQASGQGPQLLEADTDSMIDPQVILEAIRDRAGRVTDFRVLGGNAAAHRDWGFDSEDLTTRSALDVNPQLESSGLLARYAQCIDDGEALFLDDFPLRDPRLGKDRRSDIRACRAGPDRLSVTWRDVTDRFQMVQRLAESELTYRLLANNSTDVVSRTRDDTVVVWVSPSIEQALGAPPEHWVGRQAITFVHPDDLPLAAEIIRRADAGQVAIQRLRVVDVHGRHRWAEFHASRFYDADGNPDGFISSFRIVDNEVAAEEAAAEARRRASEAEAIYRRSMENSAVATALGRSDGALLEVNDAFCGFFGYDAETMLTKTWIELTNPDHRATSMAEMADLAAGRIDSFRITKKYVHADGHPIWGELFVGCLRRDDGGLQRVIAQIVDITAEVTTRQELQESRDLLEASANSMLDPQAIFEAIRDSSGRVTDFRVVRANETARRFLSLDRETLVGRTLSDVEPNLESSGLLSLYAQCLEDGQGVALDDFPLADLRREDERRYDIRATRAGPDVLSLTWSDVTQRFNDARLIAASEEQFRIISENMADVIVRVADDGTALSISRSLEDVLGMPPEDWIGRSLLEIVPPADLEQAYSVLETVTGGGTFVGRAEILGADGTPHWIHESVTPYYDASGERDGLLLVFRIIDDEVEAEQVAAEAERRFRKLMDNAPVGMCIADASGHLESANEALCDFFGYDAETLTHMTWQKLTAPGYLDADLANGERLVAGEIDSYRLLKQYIRADGRAVWGDLSVSCLRDKAGAVERLLAQVVDVTAEVEAREENRALAARLQLQSDLMASEIHSAANYVSSILPNDIEGAVQVSSRYLPSRGLAGDCFDFRWLDDDHLMVYLIDVSGHGIEPALLSISIHNLLRSGSLSDEILHTPARVLAELNLLFQMENHGDQYFTMWFRVYEKSSRTISYASAGAPPALLFDNTTGVNAATELSTDGRPVGVFEDTLFTTHSRSIPPGSRVLIFSDGAYEVDLGNSRYMTLDEFKALTIRMDPDTSLDQLLDDLEALIDMETPFEDDVSLIQLTFD